MGPTPYLVAFAAGIGALLGGGHGAILAATIVCGIIIVVSTLVAAGAAKQQKEAEEAAKIELANLVASGQSEWNGQPGFDVDSQSGIPVERKTDDA